MYHSLLVMLCGLNLAHLGGAQQMQAFNRHCTRK